MNEFYNTLLNASSLEFTSNQANQFKVRLPRRLSLTGNDWKVAISSAFVPRMSLFEDLQSSSTNLIEIWRDIDKTQYASYGKRGWVGGADLKQWESQNCCRQGVDFFNLIKTAIDERRYVNIPVGANIASNKWSTLEYKTTRNQN